MSAHYYTQAERKVQLAQLETALVELIPIAKKLELTQLPAYEQALAQTRLLRQSRFTQEELTALSHSVPDPIPRHRDWESNFLIQQADGRWKLPDWLTELEAKLQPALAAALDLRQLGYY